MESTEGLWMGKVVLFLRGSVYILIKIGGTVVSLQTPQPASHSQPATIKGRAATCLPGAKVDELQ